MVTRKERKERKGERKEERDRCVAICFAHCQTQVKCLGLSQGNKAS
jgi:hypothetical protein